MLSVLLGGLAGFLIAKMSQSWRERNEFRTSYEEAEIESHLVTNRWLESQRLLCTPKQSGEFKREIEAIFGKGYIDEPTEAE